MDLVEEQLTKSKTIAVVGLSDNPERDSHRVSRYMRSQGYRIIPVNPMIQEWLGREELPGPEVGAGAHRHGGHLPAFGAGAAGGGRGYRSRSQVHLDAGRGRQPASSGQGRSSRHPGNNGRLNAPPTPPPVRRPGDGGGAGVAKGTTKDSILRVGGHL